MTGKNILNVVDVSKRFGGLLALKNVTVNIPRERTTLIIGPNGAGKTTLTNVIAGVYKPDGGKIFFEDSEITGKKPHEIQRMGVVRTFQTPTPFPALNVIENMLTASPEGRGESFVWSMFKRFWVADEENSLKKAQEILERLKLAPLSDALATELSGGQSKLLELGRALMAGKRLLILDEPISGVAPTLAHDLMTHISSLKRDLGITFLIIEHRLDIALGYADNVIAMANGSIIVEGGPEDVMNDPRVIEAYLGVSPR